jgi:transposase-like protein
VSSEPGAGHLSVYYEQSEKRNAQLLFESPAIHVDETQVNIQGTNHYVWVFTNGKHVVFRFTETRESTVVHDFLSDYKGVLVSDFYPGYDSVSCAQQKCWVHLIRDINEDLWKAPFNTRIRIFCP